MIDLHYWTTKFGENPYHLKHRSVGRRQRVEALSMREQVDLFGGQFAQQVKKLRQRAAQPIEAVTTTRRETVRPGPDWRRLTVLAADWPWFVARPAKIDGDPLCASLCKRYQRNL